MPVTHKGHGLRLLSLDGGGIRGLSELLILQEIMQRIQSQENLTVTPDPCDYFDLIGGTSTGGIIALMLGRLRIPIAETIKCYQKLSEKIFSDKKIFGDGKFRASNLETIMKEVVKNWTGNADERMMDTQSEGNVCKTFVCAMPALNMSAGIPHLFRAYPAPQNQTINCTIWEAARATSAAPTFFKQIQIGELGSLQAYVDGGLGCNNPIVQILEEAEVIFPGQEVACIISIGTGHPQTIHIPSPNWIQRVLPTNVLQAIKGIATDCQRSAEVIAQRFEGVSNVYFRFNVIEGLQKIGLEQWEKLEEVTAHTRQYLQMTEVGRNLAAAVIAILERQEVVSTAHITGKIWLSGRQQTGLKRCPPPTPMFTGRQNILLMMREYFSIDFGKRHVFVLYGLGGTGKSQIAFKFVNICQTENIPNRFSDVFFVDASSVETIIADLRSIAVAKQVGKSENDILDWLAGQHKEWLLIFNNADDTTFNLGDYFPVCNHGNILITSRNRDMIHHTSGPGSCFRVSGMETNDAISLLLKVAGLWEADCENKALAVQIVKELGNLALAVAQVGAYICSTQCSLGYYLDMFWSCRDGLLQESHNRQKNDGYNATVYTTWKVSFEKLSCEAIRFLQLCAFLHHDGISEAIFRNAACNIITYKSDIPIDDHESDRLNMAKEFLESFRSPEMPWDSQKFLKLISEIKSYSLIDFDEVNRTYSIHPLVHAWTRTTISKPEVFCTCIKFILGVSITWEFESDDYAFRRSLLSHVDMALQDSSATGLYIFAELALVYSEAGRWGKAGALQSQVLEASQMLLGEAHPYTLDAMYNVAVTYGYQGRLKEAENLKVQVKDASMKVLGPQHPSTLVCMGDLAVTYQYEGRLKEAEELHLQVKQARLNVLGAEHPQTLLSIGNLASTYRQQGRWREAEELEIQVWEARQRVLGEEHPDTLASMGHLASTYWSQGRWKEAEELDVRVKDARLKVLGPEHPDTLMTMSNLATMYSSQGQLKKAEELHIQTKEAREKLLGRDHQDTLMSMGNLAVVYSSQGRWEEAEELNVQVKDIRMRVLGAEHPDTLTSIANLAVVYYSQGWLEEAEELEIQVWEMRRKVLGEEHPETLSSAENLALTYHGQGRWKEALELQVQANQAMIKVLGAKHPNTLHSMVKLATMYGSQEQWKKAEELLIQVEEASPDIPGLEADELELLLEEARLKGDTLTSTHHI